MNSTETAARKWIAKEHGVSEYEVVFSSSRTPDFITPGGFKYEVKRLYGDRLIFYPSQIDALRQQENIKILVFAKDASSPVASIPAPELVNAVDECRDSILNMRLTVVDGKRFQVYLTRDLQNALQRYIEERYPAGTRLSTAIFRRALAEFLEKEGYYDRKVPTS